LHEKPALLFLRETEHSISKPDKHALWGKRPPESVWPDESLYQGTTSVEPNESLYQGTTSVVPLVPSPEPRGFSSCITQVAA